MVAPRPPGASVTGFSRYLTSAMRRKGSSQLFKPRAPEDPARAWAMIEQRAKTRIRVRCPAELRLPDHDLGGHLRDLSELGARIQLRDAPLPGTRGLLRWLSYASECDVIWRDGNLCGVAFHTAVSRAVILQTVLCSQDKARADVGNIRYGTARSKITRT